MIQRTTTPPFPAPNRSRTELGRLPVRVARA
jgi:hypothetical protein